MLESTSYSASVLKPVNRLQNIDALRVILILLGVVLHSADVYRPSGWLVADRENAPIYAVVADFIHIFRMPALFFVSGLLLRLTLHPRHLASNVFKRSLRLVLPFIVTAFTVNSAIQWFQVACAGSTYCKSWAHEGAERIQHLWFLSDLLLFSLVGLITLRFSQYFPPVRGISRLLTRPALLVAFLCVLTWFCSGLALITPYRYHVVALGSGFVNFVMYACFFFCGCCLGTASRIAGLAALRFRVWHSIVLCLVLAACLYDRADRGTWHLIQTLIIAPVGAWGMIFALWRGVNCLPEKSQRWVGKFAPLCFSIYLVHTLFVVALGWLFTYWHWPVAVEFAAVALGAAILSIWAARLIEWVPLLKLALNGVVPAWPEMRLNRRQEQLQLRRLGLPKKGVGRAHLMDHALMHKDHAVANTARKVHFMGHHH
jgi:glucans biosynthesis protein C